MNKTEAVRMLRREFLASSSILLLSAASLKGAVLPFQASPKGLDVSEKLNPAELEMVNNSIMAKDMDNFWHKGYSCAETGLMVALRFLKRPEDLVWVAGGFGGGMMHQDLPRQRHPGRRHRHCHRSPRGHSQASSQHFIG